MENEVKEQIALLNSAMSRVLNVYENLAKKHGLNYNSLMVLYTMYEVDVCTQKTVSQRWLIPKQTVHSILKEFEKKGYIYFEPYPNNKREKILKLTPEGRLFADSVLEKVNYIEEKTMENLGDKTRSSLVESTMAHCEEFERIFKEEMLNE